MAWPEHSSLFTPWQDPQSGITSYLLSQRVAPIQMGFYFVNAEFTDDGRYLWFWCIHPPGGQGAFGPHLGIADLVTGEIHGYPETMFMDASPSVDTRTGEAFWTIGLEFWKRGPRPNDPLTLIGNFPTDVANSRRPRRIATHLTRSADGKSFCFDAEFSPDWYVGDIPVDGSGPARIWQQFPLCHNHAQFSPTDPDEILLAQDGWNDAATGKYGGSVDRLWLLRRGDKARPIIPDDPQSSDRRGHEWWDADGRHVWYIDYRLGTEKVDTRTGKRVTVWPHGHTHSHSDRQSRYLIGDIAENPQHWELAFYNIATGKEVHVVTRFPHFPSQRASAGWSLSATTPNYHRSHYHVHPHPHFCCNDRYICYTTNVRGPIDIALVDVEQLVAHT